MIARLMTPYGELTQPNPVQGIYRITRFPGSLGILLWSLLHLASTGDVKRVLAFSVFALIAVTALVKNERLLGRQEGEAARAFRAATSLVPFGNGGGSSIVALKETGWKPLLAAVVLYGGLLVLHPIVLGVGPLDRF